MTDLPSLEPKTSRKRPLGLDDFIGIFVAFTTIGGILFWVMSRPDRGFRGFPALVESPLSAPLVQASPTPVVPTAPLPTTGAIAPTPTVQPPTVGTTDSIKLQIPTPFATTTQPRVIRAIPLIVIPPAPPKAVPTKPKAATPAKPKAGTPPVQFSDVSNTFWAFPFIDLLRKRNIVGGLPDGNFQPNKPVNRAEFAQLLQTAFDENPTRQAEQFKDIPANFWAQPAIEEATKTNFMRGYPENVFRPQQQIPKVQAIVALANGLGLQPPSNPDKILQTYKDANQIPAWARNPVAAATAAGLVVNHPDLTVLNPNKLATRADVSALIYQGLVKVGKAQPVNSKYVVKP